MSNNSRAWNHTNVVDYFNKNRTSESGVYPSEWFFLKKLLGLDNFRGIIS